LCFVIFIIIIGFYILIYRFSIFSDLSFLAFAKLRMYGKISFENLANLLAPSDFLLSRVWHHRT